MKFARILRKKFIIILNQYIIYNDQFEVLIYRICKVSVIEIYKHFIRIYQIDISFENREEIDEYNKDLIL